MDTPISSERANSKKMMEEDDVLLFTDNKVARSGLPVPSKDENDWNDETEPPDMQEGFHSMSRHAGELSCSGLWLTYLLRSAGF